MTIPPDNRPELSVVIPARDAATTLTEQLDALLSQEWAGAWEVVVVNNLSTDATEAIVEAIHRVDSRFRVVDAAEHPGLSYARNTGILHARSDHIAVCDADDVVGEGWIEAMAEGLRVHPVVTGPLELDLLNPPWLADIRGRVNERQLATFFGIFPVAAGGNFGVRRDVWEQVGGFEEASAGADDLLFSLHLWRAGIPVHFEPRAVVHYRYRTSIRELWKQGRGYGAMRPFICKRLRDAHAQTPPRVSGWRSWIWLLVNTPRLLTRTGRAAWIWVAANRVGQLEGCVRYRVFYL